MKSYKVVYAVFAFWGVVLASGISSQLFNA